jgi:hypothetical protein
LIGFFTSIKRCKACDGLDNEGDGGQQEGEFKVFEGGKGTGSASIHDTGEVERRVVGGKERFEYS